jgi:hypothetical protein
MMTQSRIGLTGSLTKACKGTEFIGREKPAILANTEECPAGTRPTLSTLTEPFVVCNPTTLPFDISIPLTSQF